MMDQLSFALASAPATVTPMALSATVEPRWFAQVSSPVPAWVGAVPIGDPHKPPPPPPDGGLYAGAWVVASMVSTSLSAPGNRQTQPDAVRSNIAPGFVQIVSSSTWISSDKSGPHTMSRPTAARDITSRQV